MQHPRFLFLRPFSLSLSLSLSLSFLPISSLFSCELQLCKDGTILWRGFVVNRYFVAAEDLVLTYPTFHRESLPPNRSVTLLLVCLLSHRFAKYHWKKPVSFDETLKYSIRPVCTKCCAPKLFELAQ